MTINVENCRKLARAIEERARQPKQVTEPLPTPMPRFYMPRFILGMLDDSICNTAGCIAGSAIALFARDQFSVAMFDRDIREIATHVLGLTRGQAVGLFMPERVNHNTVEAKHAVAMLDWLADNPEACYFDIEDRWPLVIRGDY